MKICQQSVHYAKPESRNNKQACFRRSCEQEFFIFRAARSAEGRIFESPNYRCADGQDGAPSRARRADPLGCFLGNLIGFTKHDVAFKRFTVDGLKCAEPHVERELADLRAAFPNSREDFGSEMKAGGWRCDGARTFGKNGLIAFTVGSFVDAIDVGRQRNVPEALEVLRKSMRVMRHEADGAQAQFSAGSHFCFKLALAEKNALAGSHFAARPNKRFPDIGTELTRQEDFNRRPEMFPARGT